MKQKSLLLLIGFLLYSLVSYGQRLSPRMDISRTAREQMLRADINDFTPFTNTIKYNHGDSILELFTPPIGNQGIQGSCAAWAFGYGCASIQAYESYQDWNWARRSPAYLFNMRNIDCSAAHTDTIARLLYTYGACSYFLMPYNQNDCETQPNPTQHADAALNKSLKSVLTDSSDVSEYKQFLQIGHPIGVYTNYGQDLKRIWNDGSLDGHWESVTNFNTDSAHALCIVGYDDHQHLFKAMNSWDSIKGDHGFVWVSYDLVQDGVFECAYVFDSRGNGFVPIIEGSSYFCSSEECYQLTNTPSGCTYTWSINSNVYPNDVISSGQGTTNVCISQQGLSPRSGNDTDENINQELPRLNFPRSVLSVNITDQNNHTYSTSKSIYDPSPKPTVSASNTATNWTAGTTRTFTITNCNSVSYTNLQWVIQKTVTALGGNSTIYTDTTYGTYMTYTPTWVTGALSITIDITATNLARHCEDNYVHLSYNVIRKHLLNAIDNGSLLDVTISDEETTSLLKQTTSNEKNLYTLELWHPIYGQMRKQPAYSTNEQININGLPQGTYILLLKKDYEIIAQTKVIIQ